MTKRDERVIHGQVYRRYDDIHWVSRYGDVYSDIIGKNMKHYITIDGHHRIDIHGKHRLVHHLVYECWCGPIPSNMQINHYDDDKDNNSAENLYAGTQKDNIRDCIANNHRKGHLYALVVREKATGETLRFCPSSDFMEYAGHTQCNKGVSRALKRKWFLLLDLCPVPKRLDTISLHRGIEHRARDTEHCRDLAFFKDSPRRGQPNRLLSQRILS